jgi:hypothetical protein
MAASFTNKSQWISSFNLFDKDRIQYLELQNVKSPLLKIFSHVRVTTDGVWISNGIYWPLIALILKVTITVHGSTQSTIPYGT